METKRLINLALICALISLSTAVGVYVTYFHQIPINTDSSAWGQFGDYMGGVLNPIFGFLGLIALLYTLKQNEKALDLSASELKLSREEVSRSADALDSQKTILDLQAFEQTYFKLIELLNSTILEFKRGEHDGRKYLRRISASLKADLQRSGYNQHIESFKEYDETFLRIYNNFPIDLEPYFRLIYNILIFIDYSKQSNKDFYINLLKAQLSNAELDLIFYYSISSKGRDYLFKVIKKYKILEYIEVENIINVELLWNYWYANENFEMIYSQIKI